MTNPTSADDRLVSREVSWQGLCNVRDLGGLPAVDGVTSFGRFCRAPRLESLTAQGWTNSSPRGYGPSLTLRNPGRGEPGGLEQRLTPAERGGDVGPADRRPVRRRIHGLVGAPRVADLLRGQPRAMARQVDRSLPSHCRRTRRRDRVPLLQRSSGRVWSLRSYSHWLEWRPA